MRFLALIILAGCITRTIVQPVAPTKPPIVAAAPSPPPPTPPPTPPPAAKKHAAIDTVHYVEPGAKCEAVFDGEAVSSARCDMGGGALVYCTASSSGFVCQPLRQPDPVPAAPAPLTPVKKGPKK
jgi:hypothetical protein